MTYNIAALYNGRHERTDATVASVSYWHIPGGYKYDQAVAVMAYFESMDDAIQFHKRYQDAPEMASLAAIV